MRIQMFEKKIRTRTPGINFLASTLLFTLAAALSIASSVSALLVAPPSSNSDWRDLATLLVNTFDEPSVINAVEENNNKGFLQTLELAQWNLIEKFLTEQFTYNQYVKNAKKMKGTKYGIYLAKEYNPGSPENDVRPFYETVGMVEIGMTLEPSVESCDEDGLKEEEIIAEMKLRPRATIGVLCVQTASQKSGIGEALLHKCEEVIVNTWDEKGIVVEVEPDNVAALGFFSKQGYTRNADEMRNATVCRKRVMEERPHFILRKFF
mmetsp:Transcript_10852/g.16446  ORF Transcript_10852/g.16446 Transcript_10852/m.16446 type:complete len:265 (-) Transcript_10852:647-1441(-)